MTRRIRVAISFGTIAAVCTVAIVASDRAWLRVLIAPAWKTGGLASRDIQSPNLLVVIVSAFVGAFALGFFSQPLLEPDEHGGEKRARLVAWNLIGLYAALAVELLFYPRIAASLIEAAGGQGGLGPAFPLVRALRLIPGAALFACLATAAALWISRSWPHHLRAGLFILWICQVLVLLGPIAWYFSPVGPESPPA